MSKRRKIIIAVIAVLVVLFVIGSASGNGKPKSKPRHHAATHTKTPSRATKHAPVSPPHDPVADLRASLKKSIQRAGQDPHPFVSATCTANKACLAAYRVGPTLKGSRDEIMRDLGDELAGIFDDTDVARVTLTGVATLTDSLGNETKDEPAVTITMTRTAWAKVTWSNLKYSHPENLGIVAESFRFIVTPN